MLLYVIPLDVLNFYFTRIHGLLQAQGHQWKGLICVSIYCLCRLLYKLVQAQHNKQKRLSRRRQCQQKYDSLLQALDELQHPLDISITDVPFHALCMQINKQPRQVLDILLAFQTKAVSTDVSTNAIVALLNPVVSVMRDHPATPSHTGPLPPPSSHSVLPPPSSHSVLPQPSSQSVFTSLIGELVTCCQPDKSESDVATSIMKLTLEDYQPLLLNNVPISLSEVIHLRSMDATAGLSAYLQVNAKHDAVVVQLLRAQGAIPVMRTNVPQTAYITFGSSNPVFGTTRNPFKSDRSPGGTCSGEAVIAWARASVLGVGTDVAGGLRIPAHFCGVCAFKPTSDRVSRTGVTVPVEGQNAVVTCVGPMSSEVAGLVAFMKCVCVPLQHHLDPAVSMSPFNQEMYESTKPLCVGFFVDDGHTKCVPSVRRAVMEAKALLEQVGYKVVPFEPPDLLHMLVNLYLPAVLGDHFFTLVRTLSVDRLDSCVRRTFCLVHLPYAVRWLWSWWYAWKNPVNASLLAARCPQSVSYWWKLIKDIEVRKLDNTLTSNGCLTYSALFNLLDFPAGTVPVSTVSAGDVADLKKPEIYQVETWLERNIRLDQLGRENEPGSSSQDLPVGVQIASLPYQDEMVLRVLSDLEKMMSGNLKRLILDQDTDMRIRI